jgi:hypothetical protein
MISFISVALRDALTDRTSPATPETWGVAIEVPDIYA